MTDHQNVIFLQIVLVIVMLINAATFAKQRSTIRNLREDLKRLRG